MASGGKVLLLPASKTSLRTPPDSSLVKQNTGFITCYVTCSIYSLNNFSSVQIHFIFIGFSGFTPDRAKAWTGAFKDFPGTPRQRQGLLSFAFLGQVFTSVITPKIPPWAFTVLILPSVQIRIIPAFGKDSLPNPDSPHTKPTAKYSFLNISKLDYNTSWVHDLKIEVKKPSSMAIEKWHHILQCSFKKKGRKKKANKRWLTARVLC